MNTSNKSTPPAAGQSAHTPTPYHWIFHDTGKSIPFALVGADGKDAMLATDDSEQHVILEFAKPANAAFILRACNSHAALVAALDRLLAPNGKSNTVAHIYETLVERDQDTIDEYEADFMQAVEQARAALNSAKGEQS